MSGAVTVVIANPTSRSGATGRRLPELERLLRVHVGDFRLYCTERARHAESLARDAVGAGATRIVVAGGDGTVSEALSGILHERAQCAVELGLLPLGSGRDFARSIGAGTDLERAVERLHRGRKLRVDAGRVRCLGADGGEATRCFLNEVSFGLSGEAICFVDELARKGRRGRAAYVLAGLWALQRYTSAIVSVRVDGQLAHDGPLLLGAVANGRYFGGGMRIAPHAEIDDGRFDVVLAAGMSRLAALACFPRLFRGTHVERPDVSERRGARVEVSSAQPVHVEADGELIGRLPAQIELLPRAITLCGLPPV